MKRVLNIQTAGSLTVVGTFALSECAAWFLDAYPGSSLAWYLNAGLFHAFENARADVFASHVLFGPASLPVALLLLALIVFARVLQSRFLVALFANLSFLGAVMLAYAAMGGGRHHPSTLLSINDLGRGTDQCLVAILLAASFVAFVVSHWSFAHAIKHSASAP